MLALIFALLPLSAHADVGLHGFADIVGSKSNSDYVVNGIGNHGRTLGIDPETRVGLNLSANPTDSLDFAGQLVARGSDGGNYNVQADWLFLTYRPNDELKFRGGRQIAPIFLYSEQVDVGYTYLPTRLPYEVYGTVPVKSVTGVGVIYAKRLGALEVSAEAFGGGASLTFNSTSSSTYAVSTYTAFGANVRGAALDLRYEPFKLHAAYTASSHSQLYVPSVTAPLDLNTLETMTVGVGFEHQKVQVTAEAVRVSDPNSPSGSASAAYGLVGYRVLPKLTPYAMLSWRDALSGSLTAYPNSVPSSSTYLTGSTSWIGGLNFQAALPLVLKAEYMNTGYRFATQSLNYRVNTYTASADLVF